MAIANRDENRIPVILGVLNTDGETVLPIYADPITHALSADDDTTGSDNGGNPDPRDENRKIAFFAISATDGITPVAVYCDSSNNLLINSN